MPEAESSNFMMPSMLPESALLLQNITCDVEEVNADYVNEAIVSPQFLLHATKWDIESCAMPAIILAKQHLPCWWPIWSEPLLFYIVLMGRSQAWGNRVCHAGALDQEWCTLQVSAHHQKPKFVFLGVIFPIYSSVPYVTHIIPDISCNYDILIFKALVYSLWLWCLLQVLHQCAQLHHSSLIAAAGNIPFGYDHLSAVFKQLPVCTATLSLFQSCAERTTFV